MPHGRTAQTIIDEEKPEQQTPSPATPERHAQQIFEQVVAGADIGAECMAGASRLPNDAGLVYKVLGMETEPVKSKVRAFWDLVRREVAGAPVPAARLWGSG